MAAPTLSCRWARTTLAVLVASCAGAPPAPAQVPEIPLQDVISAQYQEAATDPAAAVEAATAAATGGLAAPPEPPSAPQGTSDGAVSGSRTVQ